MRKSAFKGNYVPNKRPYVVVDPDVFVSIQGETSVIACGECRKEVNINDYVTGISTEASVDSSPGSATINLSIPDTDVNNFFVDGQLIIIPMMEVEIFAKGYFLVGGFPQYYRTFWGVVGSVTKSWSGGTTTVQINCKDILRWWELTMVTINPAFLESFGGSAGGYQLWQNQFAAQNPVTIIINLAREAMGDFSLTTGSFTSFQPEKGPEGPAIGAYARDVMAYWQLKFGNIWNNLVIYGSSGQMYTFRGDGDTVSPVAMSREMFAQEEALSGNNQATSNFKIQPGEITPFKQELDRAGDVEFFQTEQQSKLSIANTCKEQSGWEFYCDPSGDIVFKPPFYNLNVLPNKPVSWIQNYEVIDDSITDDEAPVFTHITSSGNAFGGTMDWGLNDEITTPRTGVIDFHLLRRYGWRRLDYQCEWAGNPKKLFYWLVDYLDRMNALRQQANVTIPMRPELRLGFPIWFPKYDSFFYVIGIAHQHAVGSQSTTTLTLTAKRSKFIAPHNMGTIKQSSGPGRTELVRNYQVEWVYGTPKVPPAWVEVSLPTYTIEFPNRLGDTAGLSNEETAGKSVVIRDPRTGRMLGYPNVVMAYRSTVEGTVLSRLLEEQGNKKAKAPAKQDKGPKDVDPQFTYRATVGSTFNRLRGDLRAQTISRLRAHRYEAGMTNGGAYDYAHDVGRKFQEMSLIPTDSITWNVAGQDPNNPTPLDQVISTGDEKTKAAALQKAVDDSTEAHAVASARYYGQVKRVRDLEKELNALLKKQPAVPKTSTPLPPTPATPAGGPAIVESTEPPEITEKRAQLKVAKDELVPLKEDLENAKTLETATKANQGNVRAFAKLNVLVRPVSDDFGFEVVGHNKYGRGAFIDRGKLQVKGSEPGEVANRITVQFAASGGLLTDPGIVGTDASSAQSVAYSFERMQPDDYITGASFSGSGNPSDVSSFNFTSQETYTNQINANTGKSLYVEADQTRKAKTLGELKPTVQIAGLDGLSNCACGLGRANWLSILPQDIIASILSGSSSADVGFGPVRNGFGEPLSSDSDTPPAVLVVGSSESSSGGDPGATGFADGAEDSSRSAVIGNVSTEGFFGALTRFLQEKVVGPAYQENAKRERRATGAGRGAVSYLFDAEEQSNVLGDPTDPLFARAAAGDPEAIKALQDKVANSNFDMSKAAAKSFKSAWNDGSEKLGQTFKTFGLGPDGKGSGPVFAVGASNGSGSVEVQVSEANSAADVEKAVSSMASAITGVPPVQTPLSKQVQPRPPAPNMSSLIVNPTSIQSKNQPLSDAKEAANVASQASSPKDTVRLPPSKLPIKKPGAP